MLLACMLYALMHLCSLCTCCLLADHPAQMCQSTADCMVSYNTNNTECNLQQPSPFCSCSSGEFTSQAPACVCSTHTGGHSFLFRPHLHAELFAAYSPYSSLGTSLGLFECACHHSAAGQVWLRCCIVWGMQAVVRHPLHVAAQLHARVCCMPAASRRR